MVGLFGARCYGQFNNFDVHKCGKADQKQIRRMQSGMIELLERTNFSSIKKFLIMALQHLRWNEKMSSYFKEPLRMTALNLFYFQCLQMSNKTL